jgi:hypothetical protein
MRKGANSIMANLTMKDKWDQSLTISLKNIQSSSPYQEELFYAFFHVFLVSNQFQKLKDE